MIDPRTRLPIVRDFGPNIHYWKSGADASWQFRFGRVTVTYAAGWSINLQWWTRRGG